MKRSILAIALLAVSSVALAWHDGLSSSSVATTGAFAASAGNGGSLVGSGAHAHNSASQYSYGISSLGGAHTGSGAATHGKTATYSFGITGGNAFGVTGANARQNGYAEGGGYGVSFPGYSHSGSLATTGSHTRSHVVNNGLRGGFTLSGAHNDSVGGVYWSRGVNTYGDTYGDTNGGAYSLSFGNTHNHGYGASSGIGLGKTWSGAGSVDVQ